MTPIEPAGIEFRDVGFSLPDGRTLLKQLNLHVNPGETLVLLGRSGSGKTTTMKLINRLLDPTAGEVRVEGKATVEWDPIRLRRHIGYVIQEIGLFPHLTVEENIGVVPRLEGWEAERIHARARELLALVGLNADRFGGRLPRSAAPLPIRGCPDTPCVAALPACCRTTTARCSSPRRPPSVSLSWSSATAGR